MAFLRGAKPSPAHHIAAAPKFMPLTTVPQIAWVPAKLDVWGNDQYGDCVTAEEAYAKACYDPEIFIPTQTVVDWAGKHGYLNGATLTDVMNSMSSDGFTVGSQQYNDGPYAAVDFSNESVLQAALAQGPVKIGIDANALPETAGQGNGWYVTGGGRFTSTDHCVSLGGFGPAGWLYQQMNVPLPSALQANQQGYLLFTWGSIGFVDHAWIMGTCTEAWLRSPTTVGNPPLPSPTPTPPPTPTPQPVPDVPVPWEFDKK